MALSVAAWVAIAACAAFCTALLFAAALDFVARRRWWHAPEVVELKSRRIPSAVPAAELATSGALLLAQLQPAPLDPQLAARSAAEVTGWRVVEGGELDAWRDETCAVCLESLVGDEASERAQSRGDESQLQ